MKYWEIIADNLSKSRSGLGLCLNRGLLQANVLFRLGAILLFPFLFLQVLLGLPPRDDEMVVFAVAPPGTRRPIPRLDKLPIGRVRRLESEVIPDCGRNIQPSPIVQIWLWPFILEHVLEIICAEWAAIFPLRVASAIFLSNSNPAILAHRLTRSRVGLFEPWDNKRRFRFKLAVRDIVVWQRTIEGILEGDKCHRNIVASRRRIGVVKSAVIACPSRVDRKS